MFTPVQVIEPRRGAVRRAVSLQCQVLADDWDEPVPYDVRDLSPGGMFLDTTLPLEPGTEMLVSLRPERWPGQGPVVARAVVRRVELRRRRAEGRAAGMGVAFVDLSDDDVENLDACLRGLPPPLPSGEALRGRRPRHATTLWVEPAS
ncbi:MAG: PilZ domain-containing protein [Myxococcota bacterium]